MIKFVQQRYGKYREEFARGRYFFETQPFFFECSTFVITFATQNQRIKFCFLTTINEK